MSEFIRKMKFVNPQGVEIIVRQARGTTVPGRIVGIEDPSGGERRFVFEVRQDWIDNARAQMEKRGET